MKNTVWLTIKYVFFDVIAAAIAWALFFTYRKSVIEPQVFGYDIPLSFDNPFYLGIVALPLFWVFLFYLTGEYRNLVRKSRLQELWSTLKLTLMGTVVLFFVLILDDYISSYKNYYNSFITLFGLQFVLTYIPRFLITNHTISKIRKGKIYFKTLIIGSGKKALNFVNEINSKPKSAGNKIIGFIPAEEKSNHVLDEQLKKYANSFDDIINVFKEEEVDEVIIALDNQEKSKLEFIISRLELLDVRTLLLPDLYDILTGNVNTTSIYGIPLLEITHELMPPWQENVKRFLDVSLSIIAMIVLIPVYIAIGIAVKINSKGPVFYSHKRIGRFGKPFSIYKFRSMHVNAEQNGPQLSNQNDSRITSVGKFLRKTRLDEIPQFFNVLIGTMSLVGPRPERQYFIDQIVQKAPHYYHLLRVRPGITSLGQVKYGYAENVNQMIDRLRFDIIYIENISLYLDFKIMIYTIKTIIEASGK